MALVNVTFPSCSLRRSVSINALIPNEINFMPGQEPEFIKEPMRTLYMLHGYSGDSNDYLLFSNIFELCRLYNIAVIFPAGENSFYLDDEDKGEFYSRFIGSELISFTRSLFHLSGRREDTYIGGLSMGGYGAMINGLRYADTFSKIVSFSGAYIEITLADAKVYKADEVSDVNYQRRVFGEPSKLRESDKDPRWCMEKLIAQGRKIPDIYQCCGKDDFLIEPNRRLHEFMEKENIPHVYAEGDGMHDWVYWQRHMEPALKWLGE